MGMPVGQGSYPPRPPLAIQVGCEAEDCEALLEVIIPEEVRQRAPPFLIIRCAHCSRVLQVALPSSAYAAAPAPAVQPHTPPPTAAGAGATAGAAEHEHPRMQGVREVLRQLSLPQLPIAPLNSPMPLSALIKQASLSKAASAAVAAQQQQQVGQAEQAGQGGSQAGVPQISWPRLEIAPLAARPSAEEAKNLEAEAAAGAKRKAMEVLADAEASVEEYQLFVSTEFHRLKQQQPELGNREAFKLAVQAWQRATTAKRQLTAPEEPSPPEAGNTGSSGGEMEEEEVVVPVRLASPAAAAAIASTVAYLLRSGAAAPRGAMPSSSGAFPASAKQGRI